MKIINFKRCFPYPLKSRDLKVFRVLQKQATMINPSVVISLSGLMKESGLTKPTVLEGIRSLGRYFIIKILPPIYERGPRQYIINPPSSWLIGAAMWAIKK